MVFGLNSLLHKENNLFKEESYALLAPPKKTPLFAAEQNKLIAKSK
jgi:hypothetical protein